MGEAARSPPQAVENAIDDALEQVGVPPLTRFPFDPSQILECQHPTLTKRARHLSEPTGA